MLKNDFGIMLNEKVQDQTNLNPNGRTIQRLCAGVLKPIKVVVCSTSRTLAAVGTTISKTVFAPVSVGSWNTKSPEASNDVKPSTVTDTQSNHQAKKDCSVSKATNAMEKPTKKIVVDIKPNRLSGSASFLTDDSTIFFIATFSIALCATINRMDSVIRNEVPFSVMACWMVVAYALGQVLAFDHSRFLSSLLFETKKSSSKLSELEKHKIVGENETNIVHIGSADARKVGVSSPKNQQFRTNLSNRWDGKRQRQTWEKLIDPFTDRRKKSLMRRLLKHTSLRRTRRDVFMKRISSKHNILLEAEHNHGKAAQKRNFFEPCPLGQYNASDVKAESFERDSVIDPMFVLRGIDVFLSDNPESELGSHPWLIEHGLRDVPTFLVNLETQWGNILVYYDMSERIHNWKSEDSECCPADVKALKHFMYGSDDYRNSRFKFMASVVEGPLVARLLVPNKSEKVIHGEYVPVSWKKSDQEIDVSGRKLEVVLECTIDLMSTRIIRSLGSIVKKNLKLLVVDVALIISGPEGEETDNEQMACLGLWRFNRIDLEAAQAIPDRYSYDAANNQSFSADVIRASKVLGLQIEDLDAKTLHAMEYDSD